MSDPFEIAVRLVSRRELSAAQVRERLLKRGVDAALVETTLERLRRAHVVDDRRAALAAARTAALVKRRGPARVLRELEAIGIARELAREAVDDAFGGHERELAESALARRLRGGRRVRDGAELGRLHAYLMRQGFSADVARSVLRQRGGGRDVE